MNEKIEVKTIKKKKNTKKPNIYIYLDRRTIIKQGSTKPPGPKVRKFPDASHLFKLITLCPVQKPPTPPSLSPSLQLCKFLQSPFDFPRSPNYPPH